MINRNAKGVNAIRKGLIAVTAISGILVWCFASPGYGKVGYKTYQFATAIYGACLAKSTSRIETVEHLLQADCEGEDPIIEVERRWLMEIMDQAKNDQWDSAATKAKKMMNDQLVNSQ